jgi:ribosome-binding protein aMBF1 (putative translation factor)
MATQVIRDKDGKPLYALVPIKEYERLMALDEKREDIATAEAAKDDETLPSEIVERLIEGENRVRVWRQYRGLRQRELAERIGISQSHLSDIEIGRSDGSFRVMAAIARALEIDLDLLAPRET